jgi:hypothetical protein
MDMHDDSSDDLTGEGTLFINGQPEGAVEYCLTISPKTGPILGEGTISGPEAVLAKARTASKVELALADGPVVTLVVEREASDPQSVRILTPRLHSRR